VAFDVQTLAANATCAECLNQEQKQNVALYLLNQFVESGGGGGAGLHNLLSLTHPDTVPGPPTRGALIVGNATPDWEALLIGPANRVLRSDGIDATWSQVVLTADVTGTLPVGNGGTGLTGGTSGGILGFTGPATLASSVELTANALVLGGGAGATPVPMASLGTATTVLHGNAAGAPTFGAVVLTTDISGVLPVANGGTNSSAALNNDRIIVSSGGALVEAAALTNGQLLIGSTGVAPVAASLTAGANITITPGAGSITIASTIGTHTILDATVHTDSVTQAVTRGSLVYGNATPKWDELVIGASGRFLGSDGTDVSWTVLPGSFSGFANPTASVGLVAVNGVATTAMRSDAAPALSQAIVPTWTGAHTWTPAANTTPITVSGYSLTGANAQSLLDLSGTWNTSGTPSAIKLNITNTASGAQSLLLELQRDSITRFAVKRSGFAQFFRVEADTSQSGFEINKRGTTGDSTAALSSGSGIGTIDFLGWDGTAYGSAASVRSFTTEAWTGTNHGSSLVFTTVAIGATALATRAILTSSSLALSSGVSLTVAAQNAVQISPFGAAAGNTGELRFLELAAGGINYAGFKAADAMAASEIYVLPNAAPAANRFLQAAAVAGGVSALSWAQVSLTVDVTGILPVANGGSGTSTAFTAGSVIFAGAAGVYSQDNAHLFYDDSANQLTVNQVNISDTSSATVGGLLFGTARFMHNFGTNNIFVGGTAGNYALTGTDNASLGMLTLFSNTSGTLNIAVGSTALRFNTTGSNNSAIGGGSLNANTTGNTNSGFGSQSLLQNTTGGNNTAVGYNSLRANTTANDNSAIGAESLLLNTTGASNCAIGIASMRSNLVGNSNTCLGWNAGYGITGSNNTMIGASTMNSISTGSNNTAIGLQALKVVTSGSNNVIIGLLSGDNLTTGSNNIVLGYNINSPTATNSNTLTIGNLIFGTGLDGSDASLSSGNIGIGVITPLAKFHVTNSAAATVAEIIKAAAAQSANLTEWQNSSATILTKVNEVGNVGVRMAATALTAYLHIAAGTTAASTAPIKLTTGTSMTTAEAGAIEFTTDDLFFTITTGAARKRLLMADATAGLTSGKMPIATTNGRLIDLTASSAYTPTNVTPDRAYDANATTLDELSDVVGSMISDLQAKGILG
jgi:hypothetical protein